MLNPQTEPGRGLGPLVVEGHTKFDRPVVGADVRDYRRDAVVFDSRQAHQHVHGRAGGRIGGLFHGLEKWLYGPTLGQSSSCLGH